MMKIYSTNLRCNKHVGINWSFCYRSQRGQVNRDIREGENKVNTLQSSRSDQLLAYGRWMPPLVKAVQAACSQFRKPPKGPIGVLGC